MSIEIETTTWMMIFFLLLLGVSIWKIRVFLPNEPLADDDKTHEATSELQRIMHKHIDTSKGRLEQKELFLAMTTDEEFNRELYWRFNINRLKQLLKNKSVAEYYKERNL